MRTITQKFFKFAEEDYKKFSKKLIPDTKLTILGVRTPIIKSLAREYNKNNLAEISNFLNDKHTYYEEWLLHGFLLSYEKDIDNLFVKLNNFIPFIDNWAICDYSVMAMKLFRKYPEKTFEKVKEFLYSNSPYTIRFGIVILLSYFLDENFSDKILELIKTISSEHYYVNTALAWFYSVALVKQFDKTIKIIEEKNLPKFVHNKSIQKAIESFRISDKNKHYLKTLKI